MYACMQVLTLEDFNRKLNTFTYAYFEDKPHNLTSASLTNGIFGQTGEYACLHVVRF